MDGTVMIHASACDLFLVHGWRYLCSRGFRRTL